MKFALSGARIFDGYRILHQHSLLVTDNHITGIVTPDNIPAEFERITLHGGLLTPGFIDLQINGAGGVQFNNQPTMQSLKQMSRALLPFGVTRILPTLITDTPDTTLKAIHAAVQARQEFEGILGIHIEGPFFSKKKNGVHQTDKIRTLQADDWPWLEQLTQLPSILTLAPEKLSEQQLNKLNALGIRLSAGHTNAKYDDILQAERCGLSGFTHLFNAMRPMSGREPGVVGAALNLKTTWAGIIADGIHVHPASLQLAIASKGFEKIFLVSDAMATVGSGQNSFELYGEVIEQHQGRLVNSEGKLAGSAITLIDAVKYCINNLNLPAEQALAMASRIPAEYMQLATEFGTFNQGSVADILLLNDGYQVERVWQAGNQQIIS